MLYLGFYYILCYNKINMLSWSNISKCQVISTRPGPNTGAQFRPNHWYMGHSPCAYFRLFTLSQGEKPILDRSARCAISGLVFNNGSVHEYLIYLNIYSLYIQIWRITTKFTILFSKQQSGNMIFNTWTFIVDPQWYFCAQKYQTAFSIMNFVC